MQAQRKAQDREYTYSDYLTWPEEEHWELIDGEAYPTYGPTALAAPIPVHQKLVGELHRRIGNYLVGKRCTAFISPIDVVFEKSKNTKTVVQPDIIVVCDPSKIGSKNIIGAPDIVVEVLSPSTTPKDWVKKNQLYERQGVKEYWIVSPEAKTIYKNVLKDGRYQTEVLEEGILSSDILEDFSLNLEEFFAIAAALNPDGR